MVWSECEFMCTFKMVFFVKAFGLFFRMIAYDCYEYEAFALPLRFKKQSFPIHDFW